METKFFCLHLQVERRKSKCNDTENAEWKLDKKVKLKKISSLAMKAKLVLSSKKIFMRFCQVKVCSLKSGNTGDDSC